MDLSGFDWASPLGAHEGAGDARSQGFGACGIAGQLERCMNGGCGGTRAEGADFHSFGRYGGMDQAEAAWEGMPEPSEYAALQKKVGEVQRKLANLIGSDVHSDEVAGLVRESESLMKALHGTDTPGEDLLHIAQRYAEGGDMNEAVDFMYGEGSAAFIASSIRAFYE